MLVIDPQETAAATDYYKNESRLDRQQSFRCAAASGRAFSYGPGNSAVDASLPCTRFAERSYRQYVQSKIDTTCEA